MDLKRKRKKNTEEKKVVKSEKKPLDLKKTAVKKVAVKDGGVKTVSSRTPRKVISSHIIISPRITEKAGMLAERQVYTFNVTRSANKHQIAAAIEDLYKVRPESVRVSSIKGKATFSRGKSGRTASGKKAYVYLKAGDKIEFV